MENDSRDPKNRIAKPHAIRFNRSVGLQTSIEPSVRTAPQKIIRVAEPVQNGNAKSNTGNKNNSGPPNGTFNPPQSQGVKRAYQGNKTNSDNKSAMSSMSALVPSTSPKKVYNPAPTPPRMQTAVTKPNASSAQPGIVDLTDDDPPSTTQAIINLPGAVSNSNTTSGPTTTSKHNIIITKVYMPRRTCLLS